jgi:exosortase H (IPTLxxWG-CTERM-specific)
MTRYVLLFLGLMLTLFVFQLSPWGQANVVLPLTGAIAHLSAWLLQLWEPQVLAQGKIIWNTKNAFAMSIEAGCNGVEAGIILMSAMLAFPAPWRAKLIGILMGNLTVQALNLVRIISLFYLGQWDEALFEWAHLYVWQALIILDVLVVFLVWLSWLAKHEPPPQVPAVA